MIAEAMIKAGAVGGIVLFCGEITHKAIKICQTIIFPPKIPLWNRCEYCSNLFTSDLLSEREGINCHIYVCNDCAEKEVVCEECQERFLDDTEELGLDKILCRNCRDI